MAHSIPVEPSSRPRHFDAQLWRRCGPNWAQLGSCWLRSWCALLLVLLAWLGLLLACRDVLGGLRAGHVLTSSVFRRVGGSRRSCSGAVVYLPYFGGTISVLSWRVVVVLRRWLTCSFPSISCLLRWCLATACLCFAGVRFPTRVKALLGDAGADHGDTCGCHFLLGGVFLGRTTPPLHARGNPRSALSDWPTAALRRCFPS
jgi:hypothetical protein